MTAGPSFGEYRADLNLRNARVLSVLAAILVPSGVVLDWFTHREQALFLFSLRMIVAVVALICLWLTYVPSTRRYDYFLGLTPVLATAVVIEIMVESLEGYSSPYFAGLAHCLLALGVIFYWSVPESLFACGLVLAIWMVPTLLDYRNVETGPFANNSFVLVVAAAIAVASNGNRFRAVEREYAARLELVHALARLKELDHAKSQFFANISHELRTPLTLILAPLLELFDRTSDKPSRDMLSIMHTHATSLLGQIDELLDLSRLDAGRLRLHLGELDLAEMIGTRIEGIRGAATALGLSVRFESTGPVPAIWGDAQRIDIILTNLLGNALKFTPAGGSITVRLLDIGDAAVVEVVDTGLGIPESDLARVFERFYQVQHTDRRRREGVGIGLALAKELSELHGGTLSVQSRLGEGSTFALRLLKGNAHFNPDHIERRQGGAPLPGTEQRRYEDFIAKSLAEPLQVEPPTASLGVPRLHGGKPRILLAEDHSELRTLLRRLLEPNYDVFEASDGQQALDSIRQSPPDLVVSDIMMPCMSGIDLCRAIKSDPLLKHVPVILLTARVGSEATLDAFAHGADDFVPKPFHPRVLLARVAVQIRIRALALQVLSQVKSAAIGTLAAGVAHEVRNPLNAIMGACSVMLSDTLGEIDQKRLLKVALDGAERVDTIVAALDAHVRPAEVDQQRPYSIREGIESTLRLLEGRLNGIAVVRKYDTAKEAFVRASAINQVVLNLLDNAIRAGSKTISVGLAEEHGRLTVRVADDGTGVAPEVMPRIFDPFFTTREPGQGTGLGLHLSHKIVDEHGGQLRCENVGSGGALFVFDVPVAS